MTKLSNKDYMANFENILVPGRMPSMTKEFIPKVAQKLDKYLTPDGLKSHVMQSQRIQKLIEYYAQKTDQSRKVIEKKVKEILDEIALSRSVPVMRWLGMLITAISKRICSGIYINEVNMNIVKDNLGQQPVLYLPSHRSYCDFILMSYICFHYQMEIPGIAAGMDFHGMVGMGTLLRKTGAFFMRRTFANDEMYWEVFRAYIYALVAVYHIGVEFFIEGTRSRTFKALMPKIGLLSMALQPLFMGEVPDVLIVPVSVSYDRLLEESLFAYELLGVPKPKESTAGFLKALRIVEEKYGRMYLDVGDPISVKNFFGNHLQRVKYAHMPTHVQKLDKNELELIRNLASEIVYQQQRKIVITTFNLIAIYFAYKNFLGQTVSLDQLSNGVLLLKTLFEELGAHIATEEKSLKIDILDALDIHSNILTLPLIGSKVQFVPILTQSQPLDPKKLKGHQLRAQTIQTTIPVISLQLYINPTLFWVARPALILLSATKLAFDVGEIQRDQLRIKTNELYAIFANEFLFVEDRREEDFSFHLDFLAKLKVIEISDRIHLHKNDIFEILLSTIAPYFCCYLHLIETIQLEFESKDFTEKELLIATQKRVEQLLYCRAEYIHPYCLALDTLSVGLSSLVQNNIVKKNKVDIVTYSSIRSNIYHLHSIFLQYCKLLPFNFYETGFVLSKL